MESFPPSPDQFSAQASSPGRLDVMGGFADYSGSLVLQMPISQQVIVHITLRKDSLLTIQTAAPAGPETIYSKPVSELNSLRDEKQANAANTFIRVVAECIHILQREKGLSFTGADVTIESQVPFGKGVAATAALLVASLQALVSVFSISLQENELPLLAQKVGKFVTGQSISLKDIWACYRGERGKLLPILCQPDHVAPPFAIPEGVHFVGIDSGIAPSPFDTYTEVKTAAFMGYSILAQHDGTTTGELEYARQFGDWSELLYNGYLTNMEPSEFEARYASLLPSRMRGQDFLDQYGVSIDSETVVNLERVYPILHSTRHPVYENVRTQYFSLLLQHLPLKDDPEKREKSLLQLGQWMYQSHTSYTNCGLGHPATDQLVQLVKDHAGRGVYGARVTGSGQGGTVCILCAGEQGVETARQIHQEYQRITSREVLFFD
jgi:L-arabinokinase